MRTTSAPVAVFRKTVKFVLNIWFALATGTLTLIQSPAGESAVEVRPFSSSQLLTAWTVAA